MQTLKKLLLLALFPVCTALLSCNGGGSGDSPSPNANVGDNEPTAATLKEINTMRYAEPVGDGVSLQVSTTEEIFTDPTELPARVNITDSAVEISDISETGEPLIVQARKDSWDFPAQSWYEAGWIFARKDTRVSAYRIPGEETEPTEIPLGEVREPSVRMTDEESRVEPDYTFNGGAVDISWTENFRGDVNNDGVVDFSDITSIIDRFGLEESDFQTEDAFILHNPTPDATVDFGDIVAVIDSFGAELSGYTLLRRSYSSDQDQVPVSDLFQNGQPTDEAEIVRIDGRSPEDNQDLTVLRKTPQDRMVRNTYSLSDFPGPGFYAYTLVYYSTSGDNPPFSLASDPFFDRGNTRAEFLMERLSQSSVSVGGSFTVDVSLENASAAQFARTRVVWDPADVSLNSCRVLQTQSNIFSSNATGFCEQDPDSNDTAVMFASRPAGDFNINEVQSGKLFRLIFSTEQAGDTTIDFITGDDRAEFVAVGDPQARLLQRDVGDPVTVSITQ